VNGFKTHASGHRIVVLDTETTGLNARLGDRVIEIAGVEVVNRRLTGNHFHSYLNPGRAIEKGALEVHGITAEFLADKPAFADVAAQFLEYVAGAELVIHNAAFDVEFLNAELALAGLPPIESCVAGVVDTLRTARDLHPGKKNSLDALCERYTVDNSHRVLHGALLDAELLADVYLAMTRGQESLAIDLDSPAVDFAAAGAGHVERRRLVVILADDAELAAHAAMLESIRAQAKGRLAWPTDEAADPIAA
jgi:DNA polymerase-3 subunit epsilon